MEAVIAADQSPPGLDAVRALLSENDNSASRPCQVRANAAALTYTTIGDEPFKRFSCGSGSGFITGKENGMSTTALRRPARTGRDLKSATELLDVNAELRTATVRVDLGEVTEATAPVVAASTLAVNSLMGQVFGERLLGLDVSPARSYLDVAIPDRNPVVVYVSLATEPQSLLKALRSNGVGTLEVDVLVLDDGLAEWARGRMEWTVRQRLSPEWPVNSP